MITEFEAQLMSLTIEKTRLAQLARDVSGLVNELTGPLDLKNESAERSARRAKVESFCDKWSVTPIWVDCLIDRHEALVTDGQDQAIRVWLRETAGDLLVDIPAPRPENPSLRLA